MSDVNCTCESGCKTGLSISGKELWFTDDEGKETLMYLDANKLVEIIKLCQGALINLTKGGD